MENYARICSWTFTVIDVAWRSSLRPYWSVERNP